MTKLHELLAVEGDLEGQFNKILQEAVKTFKEKGALFIGKLRKLRMFDAEAPKPPDEFQEMTTTVADKLDFVWETINRYLSAVAQKELTNQQAVADLVVGDEVLAKSLPATLLLGLESRLKKIRDVYDAIPTLPPGTKWERDETRGPNIWHTYKPEDFKTQKKIVPQILYDATPEHPAQVDKISVTENVGMYSEEIWCGALTSAEKSVLLGRVDALTLVELEIAG